MRHHLRYLVVFAILLFAANQVRASIAPPAPAADPRVSDVDAELEIREEVALASARQPLFDAPIRTRLGRLGAVYLPAGLTLDGRGRFDLVLHFHGGAAIIEPQFQRAGVDAVLVTINLGNGSRVYAQRLNDPTALDALVKASEALVRERGGVSEARVGRIALSSWSAGYGAVGAILRRGTENKRIDALLMADGIHSSFSDRTQRRIADIAMHPYLEFAERARRQETLMVVTHSQIQTLRYASTTETASYLATTLGMAPSSDCQSVVGMTATGCYQDGDLALRGFAGGDKQAHIDQVRHIDASLFASLKARWSATVALAR